MLTTTMTMKIKDNKLIKQKWCWPCAKRKTNQTRPNKGVFVSNFVIIMILLLYWCIHIIHFQLLLHSMASTYLCWGFYSPPICLHTAYAQCTTNCTAFRSLRTISWALAMSYEQLALKRGEKKCTLEHRHSIDIIDTIDSGNHDFNGFLFFFFARCILYFNRLNYSKHSTEWKTILVSEIFYTKLHDHNFFFSVRVFSVVIILLYYVVACFFNYNLHIRFHPEKIFLLVLLFSHCLFHKFHEFKSG